MEMGESAAEGAARETLEEACASVQVLGLFAHVDIPLIGQVWSFFLARFVNLCVRSLENRNRSRLSLSDTALESTS